MLKKTKIAFIPKTEYVPAYAPPPEPMSKNLPTWWRKQQPYVDGVKEPGPGMWNETVKKCPGIFDLITTGYLLKTPCDFYVDTTGDELITKYHELHQMSFGHHSKKQVSAWNFDKDLYMEDVFRINPMWVVKTPPGYSTLFIHPAFNEDLPYQIVPAIIDTDKYVSDGPFSVLMKRGLNQMVEQGTPLVQCIPFKREDYEMEILQNPDPTVFGPLKYVIRSKFGGAYKKFLQSKKVYK